MCVLHAKVEILNQIVKLCVSCFYYILVKYLCTNLLTFFFPAGNKWSWVPILKIYKIVIYFNYLFFVNTE